MTKVTCDHCTHEFEGLTSEAVQLGWALNLDNSKGVACPTCVEIDGLAAEISIATVRKMRMMVRLGAQGLTQGDIDAVRKDWNALFTELVDEDRSRMHERAIAIAQARRI